LPLSPQFLLTIPAEMLFCPSAILNSRGVAISTDSKLWLMQAKMPHLQAMISCHPHQSVKNILNFLDISSHFGNTNFPDIDENRPRS